MTIGGYNQFSFVNNNYTLHDAADKFQSARAALYAFLKVSAARKIYLPSYICDSILPAINSLGVDIVWYEIGVDLLPTQVIAPTNEGEYFLLVNYFGLLTDEINALVVQAPKRFIVDNSQALFASPVASSTTIYSFRKFLAMPDGGALYTFRDVAVPEVEFPGEKYLAHLMLRAAGDVQKGYGYFLQAERALDDFIPNKMSRVSEYLLRHSNLAFIKLQRQQNFQYLATKFSHLNRLKLVLNNQVPLCYPLFLPFDVSDICNRLVEKQVFLPRYWKSHSFHPLVNSDFYNNTLFIPIDERLSESEIATLCEVILKEIKSEYSR